MYKIKLKNNKIFYCGKESTIFEAAKNNKINLEQEPPPPPAYKAPPKPETPEAPAPKAPKTKEEMVECPTRAQQLKDPVGKILEGNKKITGYEMVGKECLPVMEQLSIPDQIIQNIPSAGMVTTTSGGNHTC